MRLGRKWNTPLGKDNRHGNVAALLKDQGYQVQCRYAVWQFSASKKRISKDKFSKSIDFFSFYVLFTHFIRTLSLKGILSLIFCET